MAQSKLTDRTELAATPANGDLLHVVDIDDTTGSAAGTSKKITVQNLLAAASGGGGAQVLTVRNNTGSTINAATAVYIDGVTGSTPTINLADHTAASSMPAVGVTNAAINSGDDGDITLLGLILNVDTSGYSVGDTLYVGTSGALTSTRPTGSANFVQNIGSVVKVSASTGSILVEGAGRSNDVPNLRDGDVFVGNASNVAEQRQLNFLDLSDTPGTYTANNAVTVNAGGTALQFSPPIRDLDDLTDVTLGATASGQMLKHDGSVFRNVQPVLGDMSNVDGTTPSNNDVLTYDTGTSQWRPQAGGGGGGTNNVAHAWGFFDSNVRDVFIPITSETEGTSRQRYNRYTAPFDGSVKAITFYSTGNLSGGTGMSVEVQKMTAGSATLYTVLETGTLSSLSSYTSSTMTFTTNSFSAGDTLYFFLTNGFGSSFGNLTGVILFEVS